MIINNRNSRDIENISLHDANFENVNYNHSEKTITINLENEEWGRNYNLVFHDVLYYEMTCCDFWGGGYNVACWSKIDTTTIFDKLLRLELVEKARSFSSKPSDYSFMDLSEFFGTSIQINSGDRLKIICKKIEVSEI